MYKLCVLHINLKAFVEEKTEVGKYDPQLLPTIRVLELALEISTELVLSTQQTVNAAQQLCQPINCQVVGVTASAPLTLSVTTGTFPINGVRR